MRIVLGRQLYFSPVTDKGNIFESIFQFIRGYIGFNEVTIVIRNGRHLVQKDQLPVACFSFFSQDRRKNIIVPAEGNAAGTISKNVNAAFGVGKREGDGTLIFVAALILQIICLVILF